MTKSIFITGGTSGIGLAVAREFKSHGFRVGICGRNQIVLEELSSEFETFKVDVTNLTEVVDSINSFSKNGLDIVFANAGIGYEKKLSTPDFAKAREIIDININGVLNTFEAATSIFLKQGHGHLVATASIAGLNGLPGVPAYSGSKAAVMKICESLSIDLAPQGINVTSINPGYIDTPLTQKNNHPMPFLATSEGMAKAIFKAIEKKKAHLFYPRLFSALVIFLSIIPRRLYRKIISFKKFNYTSYNKNG